MDKKKVLEEYVATAYEKNYNYEEVNKLFPEIDEILESLMPSGLPDSARKQARSGGLKILEEYVATAAKYNYDYDKVNELFPELFPELKKKEQQLPDVSTGVVQEDTPISVSESSEETLDSSSENPLLKNLKDNVSDAFSQSGSGFTASEIRSEDRAKRGKLQSLIYETEIEAILEARYPDLWEKGIRSLKQLEDALERERQLPEESDGSPRRIQDKAYIARLEGVLTPQVRVTALFESIEGQDIGPLSIDETIAFYDRADRFNRVSEAQREAALIDSRVIDVDTGGDYREYKKAFNTQFAEHKDRADDYVAITAKSRDQFMGERFPEAIQERLPSLYRELSSEISSLKKELEDNKDELTEDLNWLGTVSKTDWGKRKEEIERRLKEISDSTGDVNINYAAGQIYVDVLENEFTPTVRQSLLDNLPEDLKNNTKFLERLEDKIFFETGGVNFDLDGDGRHNALDGISWSSTWSRIKESGPVVGLIESLVLDTESGRSYAAGAVNLIEGVKVGGRMIADVALPYLDSGLDESVKRLHNLQQEMSGLQTAYDYGMIDSFSNGDYANGMSQFVNGFAGALPQLTMQLGLTAVGLPMVAASITGVSGAGGSYTDLMSQKDRYGQPLYTKTQAFGLASMDGSLEMLMSGVTSRIFKGAQLATGVTLRDLGTAAFRSKLKGPAWKHFVSYAGGALSKFGIAGTEEAAVAIFAEIINMEAKAAVSGVPVDWSTAWKDVVEQFVIEFAMGGTAQVVGSISAPTRLDQAGVLTNSVANPWYAANIAPLQADVKRLETQLETATEEQAKGIQNEIDAKTKEIQDRGKLRRDELYDLAASDPETFQRIYDNNAKMSSIAVRYKEAEERGDKKTQQKLKEEYAELIKQQQDLFNGSLKKTEAEIKREKAFDNYNSILSNVNEMRLSTVPDAFETLNSLKQRAEEVYATGDKDRIASYERAKAEAETTYNMALSDSIRIEKAFKELQESIEALEKMTPEELSDSEKVQGIKDNIRDIQEKLSNEFAIENSGDYLDVAIIPGSKAEVKANQRDSKWDANAKSNLKPSNRFKTESELKSELDSGVFGMLTAENPNKTQLSDEENAKRNKEALDWLRKKGYDPQVIFGKYDNSENSFYVPNLSRKHAVEFAIKFQQESVAHSEGLIYQDGTFNPRTNEQSVGIQGENYYSSINIDGKVVDFSVGYDTDTRLNTDGTEHVKPESSSEIFSERQSEHHVTITTKSDGSILIDPNTTGLTQDEAKTLQNIAKSLSQSKGVPVNVVVASDNAESGQLMNDYIAEKAGFKNQEGLAFDGLYTPNADGSVTIFVNPSQVVKEAKGNDSGLKRVILEEAGHALFNDALLSSRPEVLIGVLNDFIDIMSGSKVGIEILANSLNRISLYGSTLDGISPAALAKLEAVQRSVLDSVNAGNISEAKAKLEAASDVFSETKKGSLILTEVMMFALSDHVSKSSSIEPSVFNKIRDKIIEFFKKRFSGQDYVGDKDLSAKDMIDSLTRVYQGAKVKVEQSQISEISTPSVSGDIFIPKIRRSLNDQTIDQFKKNNPDVQMIKLDDIPEAPFTIEYTERVLEKRYNEFYESPRTREFQGRSHFIEWWKKTNFQDESKFLTNRGGAAEGSQFGGWIDLTAGKPVFHTFKLDGKVLDLEPLDNLLQAPKLKGVYRVKVNGAGTYSYNSFVTDLSLAYENSLGWATIYGIGKTKRLAKYHLENIQRLEAENNKKAEYWGHVEEIKNMHMSLLRSVNSDLESRSVAPMEILKPEQKYKSPDFFTLADYLSGNSPVKGTASVSITSAREMEIKKRAQELREISDFKDAKNIAFFENIARRQIVSEELRRMYPEAPVQMILSLLAKEDLLYMSDKGIDSPMQWAVNYNEEAESNVKDIVKQLGIDYKKQHLIVYNIINGILSNGTRQFENIDAANKVFTQTMANHKNNSDYSIDIDLFNRMLKDRSISVNSKRVPAMLSALEKANELFKDESLVKNGNLNSNALMAKLGAKSRTSDLGKGSVAQDLFGAKIGAYILGLSGNYQHLPIDTHVLQHMNALTGQPFNGYYDLSSVSNDIDMIAKDLGVDLEISDAEKIRLIKEKVKESKDRNLTSRWCHIIQKYHDSNLRRSGKDLADINSIVNDAQSYFDREWAESAGMDPDVLMSSNPEMFADSDGNFIVPPFIIGQYMYAANQLATTGKYTTASAALLETPELVLPSDADVSQLEMAAIFKPVGKVHSEQLQQVNVFVPANSTLQTNVTFNRLDSEDVMSLLSLGIGDKSSFINSESETTQEIDTSMSLVEIFFNPLLGAYPTTRDGQIVKSADEVYTIDGKMYVRGGLEISPRQQDGRIKKDNEFKVPAAVRSEGLKNLQAYLDNVGIEAGAETVYNSMTYDQQRQVMERGSDLNTLATASLAGKRLRQTAERAATAFPGLKGEIIANPENYISRQNLQSIKDRMETMSEADLISLMRDDALGRLQNRNDDTGALAGAELINRAIQRGDMEAIPNLIEELAKIGTTAGRVLRQFRELKMSLPEGFSSVIQSMVEKRGNKLSPEQKAKLDDISARMYKARDKYNELKKRALLGEDVEAELRKAVDDLSNIEKELNTMVNNLVERGWGEIGKMLVQGNLLTPMSQIVNVGANLVNLFGKGLVDSIAIPVERLANMFGMHSEYKRKHSFMAYVHGWKAFGNGLGEATKTMFTGKNVDQTVEWNMHRGFMPIQSLLAILGKGDIPLNDKGNPSMSQKIKLGVSATLGVPAEIMFRMLSIGDVPFRRYSEAIELYRIGKEKGLEGEALRTFMRHPDQASQRIAVREGRKLTFQEETTVSEFANQSAAYIEKTLGTGLEYVVGKGVIDPEQVAKFVVAAAVPYRTTPANILHESLTYLSPYYAAARIASGVRRKDARAVAENFGKMMVGSVATTTAIMLIKEGLMSAPLDWQDDEKKNLAYDQFPPSSINVSGIMRMLRGEDHSKQPDDYFINYEKLGIVGATMGAVAMGTDRFELRNRDYEDISFAHRAFNDIIGISPLAGVSHMMDQSFMQGMQTLISTMAASAGSDDWAFKVEKWMESYFKATSATVLPNTLSAMNRAQREFLPDMRVTRDMSPAERLAKTLEYTIKDRTFNTDDVVVRVDWKGNRIKQNPEGANPLAYQLFDITKARQAEADPVSNEMWRLYESTGQVPDVLGTPHYAKKSSLTLPKETSFRSKKAKNALRNLSRDYTFLKDEEFVNERIYLNTEQLNNLMEVSGRERYKEVQALLSSSEYQKLGDDEKLEKLNDINKKYRSKVAMEGNEFLPHTVELLNIVQDIYESRD